MESPDFDHFQQVVFTPRPFQEVSEVRTCCVQFISTMMYPYYSASPGMLGMACCNAASI